MPSWKHQKNLTMPDEPIVGVKPSDWNAELNAEGLVGHLVGVPSGTASQKLQDIPIGTGLSFQGGTLVTTGLTADAPSNGTLYGRSNGAWAASAPASHTHPSSQITDLEGRIQVAITAFGGGIPEAPLTGVAFGRKNGGWVAVPDTAHTHVATQITDFAEAVEDRVATLLRPGTGITLAYNDAVNTLTITATAAGGGISDGDKGDITVAGGGTTLTIDNGAVTYGKMQAVSSNILLGRATAGSGVIEEIPLTSSGRQILASGSFATMLTTLGAAPIAHSHSPAEITGLQEQVQDWVGTLLVAGTGVTLNYNDAANTLTITSTGGGEGGGGGSLPAYALTNVSIDRILDADSTSIDEMADVLGTLIADIQAGGVGGGGTSPAGTVQELATTRTAAISTLFDASVKYVRTAGFAAVGDKGDGLYARLSTAPTMTNRAYFRSMDRFMADGTTDATNGGYWQLVPEGGEVRIEQFGGKADFNFAPASATDNYPAIVDSQAFIAWMITAVERYAYKTKFGYGRYWVSQMVDLHVHSWLQGMSVGYGDQVPSELYWPSTTTCILISQNNTIGESGGSDAPPGQGSGNQCIIDGLCISQYWPTTAWDPDVYTPRHGIHSRAICIIRNCLFRTIAGHAIYIHGNSGAGGWLEGAPNGWQVRDTRVHTCSGHALCVHGADSNAGGCYGFSVHNIGGCAIWDGSYYVNSYHEIHINDWGRGVSHEGKLYALIHPINTDPNIAPNTVGNTTVPGTNNQVWYHLGNGAPSVVFPAWSSDPAVGKYIMNKLPIWDGGGGRIYTGVYVESGATPAHVPGGSIIIGGTIGCTIYSNHFSAGGGFLATARGIGAYAGFPANTAEWVANGEWAQVRVGGPHRDYVWNPTTGGLNILAIDREKKGRYEWGFVGEDMKFIGAGSIWEISGAFTTTKYGSRNAPDNSRSNIVFDNLMVRNPADYAQAVRLGAAQQGYMLSGDEYVVGDCWLNTSIQLPYYPNAAWVCTVAGVREHFTWAVNAYLGRGVLVKTSAGRYYRLRGTGTTGATIAAEPTHTSGEVATSDGLSWMYAGNTAAVIKPAGPVMGGYNATANDPVWRSIQVWQAAGVHFDGQDFDITDEASAATSRLAVWKAGGNPKVSFGKQGGVGVFGATPPTAQPTVTGSRGGNAALASLITALAATGLIVDGTTA